MKQYQPLESLTDGLPAGDALGMRVRVTVDRPMGSRRPRNPETLYPVNCGHVEGIVGGDGAPQNVCILGVKGPVRQFTGRVIAVIHRADGCGEEWVAAPEGMVMFEPEIRAAMHCAEQFFQGSCRCLYEKVCGIVPYIGQGNSGGISLFGECRAASAFPRGTSRRMSRKLPPPSGKPGKKSACSPGWTMGSGRNTAIWRGQPASWRSFSPGRSRGLRSISRRRFWAGRCFPLARPWKSSTLRRTVTSFSKQNSF